LAQGILWFLTPLRQSWSNQPATSYTHEFIEYSTRNASVSKGRCPFPSIFEPLTPAETVKISLIAPAYNEEKRLNFMMDATMTYLTTTAEWNKKGVFSSEKEWNPNMADFEVIIVDDGSKDNTTQLALQYSQKYTSNVVRVLTLGKNQGKGGAVQQGMLHARGKYLLMVDADGATEIRDLSKVFAALQNKEKDGHGIAVGSRAHLAEVAVAKRKWYRNILMYGFHFLVSFVGGIRGINDTQCGFKLFTRKTAQQLFLCQQLRRWCFDVELLHLAQRLGIPIAEVAVRWEEIPGSKLNLIESSILMGRDLVVIRLAYMLGLWKILSPETFKPMDGTSLSPTAPSSHKVSKSD
jgi:dolichyl-phosphate beta-glucosyltransferase